MPSLLDIDKERTEIFFALHHDLLQHCSVLWDAGNVWKSPEGKRLIEEARTFFGYSSTTIDLDIMRVLVKRFDPQASRLL